MKLSIVTTLYYSAPYIEEFYSRCKASIPKEFAEYEFVFVNDGSPDDSLEVAIKLQKNDAEITVIELSRNFGHHKAIMTGLQHAKGDYVFLIDVDLEEEPELLTSFWNEHIKNGDLDVIYGVQEARKGNWFEKKTGGLFYIVFNNLSETKIPPNLILARLMSKSYVHSLILHQERELFLAGLFELTGFSQLPIAVNKLDKGKTVYTFKRKITLLVNAIASFSNKPLQLIFYIGGIITIISTIFILYILAMKLLHGFQSGWASTIASIWFLGGIIIMSIGVVGIYISKIFIEVKQRPYSLIRKIHQYNE